MNRENTTYILGGGAIGFPLAAYLGKAGRRAMVVRTSRNDVDLNSQPIEIRDGENLLDASVETVSLARLDAIDGIIVVTAKAHANAAIAGSLKEKGARGPIVVLQNGIGVETPFIEAGFPEVYRCVLYFTAQSPSDHVFSVKPVSASPIGVIHGTGHRLAECVDVLNTGQFPFRVEPQIQRDIWKKAIANAAFNSICPLLEIDNGIFARDAKVAALAREVVRECLLLTRRLPAARGRRADRANQAHQPGIRWPIHIDAAGHQGRATHRNRISESRDRTGRCAADTANRAAARRDARPDGAGEGGTGLNHEFGLRAVLHPALLQESANGHVLAPSATADACGPGCIRWNTGHVCIACCDAGRRSTDPVAGTRPVERQPLPSLLHSLA